MADNKEVSVTCSVKEIRIDRSDVGDYATVTLNKIEVDGTPVTFDFTYRFFIDGRDQGTYESMVDTAKIRLAHVLP